MRSWKRSFFVCVFPWELKFTDNGAALFPLTQNGSDFSLYISLWWPGFANYFDGGRT